MPINRVELDATLADVRALEAELTSWGLHQTKDRLAAAAEALVGINAAVASGKGRELEARADFEDLVWATVESMELAMIYRGLQPLNSMELAPLFELALEGPLNPTDERAGTTARGRNTMFQLRLGAGLRSTGATISFENPSDINLEVPGGRLLIECKRPFKGQNVGSLILDAKKQLASRTSLRDGVGGLVAVSVSRVLNSGHALLVTKDQDTLRATLGNQIDLIHSEHWPGDGDVTDLRLVGALYHGFTPAIVGDPGVLSHAGQTNVYWGRVPATTLWPVGRGEGVQQQLMRGMGD